MSRVSEAGLWVLAGTASLALHVGGVSAALMMTEAPRAPEPPTTLEVISLPTTVSAPVSTFSRAARSETTRLEPSAVAPTRPAATRLEATAPIPAPAVKALSAPDVVERQTPVELPKTLQSSEAANALRPAEDTPTAPVRDLTAAPRVGSSVLAPAALGAAPPTRLEQSARLEAPPRPSPQAAIVPPMSGLSASRPVMTQESTPAATAVPVPSATPGPTGQVTRERLPSAAPTAPVAVRTTAAVVPRAAAPAAKEDAVPVKPVKPEQPASSEGPSSGAVVGGNKDGGDGEEQVAMTMPPVPVPPPKPTAAESRALIVKFLREHDDGWCFVAMLSSRPGGSFGLDGYTDNDQRTARFMKDFETSTRFAANPASAVVSPAQCRALTFARTLARYPQFSLRFRLDQRELGNGEALSGTILNSAGRPVHLLVVDDEGKVQNLDKHIVEDGSGTSFAAPMTLTAGPVSTVQLLVAIGGDKPFETIDALDGRTADEFFDALTEEIAARGIAADVAITSFSIR